MTGRIDLGAFDAPVLVFGGTYGNLQATEALFEIARRADIPPKRMIHTGDAVAYCADPQATVDLLRERGVAVVMGNCEESLGAGAEDCGCGFAEGGQCDTYAARWYAYCDRALDRDAKRWMAALPRQIDFTLGRTRIAAIHGASSQINRFVFESEAAAVLTREIDATGAEGVVAGHAGLPFFRDLGDRFWLNAGAVGMPANDGTRRGWYAILAPRTDGIAVDLRPLDYDATRAAARMQAEGLPDAYADALLSGLWDSCEILPASEAARRGRPLRPAAATWRRRLRAA